MGCEIHCYAFLQCIMNLRKSFCTSYSPKRYVMFEFVYTIWDKDTQLCKKTVFTSTLIHSIALATGMDGVHILIALA